MAAVLKKKMKPVTISLTYPEQTAICQWALMNPDNNIVTAIAARIKEAAEPRKNRGLDPAVVTSEPVRAVEVANA